MWSGLGYYSRARRIHEAAKVIVERFAGVLPSDPSVLQKEIPGVGRYTANAIASIAYNQRVPVVDGNVARVLSRVMSLGSDPKSKTTIQKLWELADDFLEGSQQNPGDHNQAVMELGATICTPKRPRCIECPINGWCRAYAEVGTEDTDGLFPGRWVRKSMIVSTA